MPTASPRPWKMFLPLAIVLVLALLWTIYWFVILAVAKERAAAERSSLAASGWVLACTAESWAGYPFHLEFTCRAPVLTYQDGLKVGSGKLLLVALAYAPWQVAALIDGPTTVSGKDIGPVEIKHERALAAVTFHGAGAPLLSSEVPAASVAEMGRVDKLMLHTRPGASPGLDVAVLVSNLSYQPPGKAALSIDGGEMIGHLNPENVLAVEKLDMNQGSLRLWGTGTLLLDESHRIAGKIDLETNDAKALLAQLAPHLDLSGSQLTNLGTMLGLLGNSAKAPLIAKDGVLYLGPFRVRELKPVY